MVTMPVEPLFTAFGETATHAPSEGSEATVTVIFDSRDFDVFYEGAVVVANEVTAVARSTDVTSVSLRDQLVIRGITYNINEIRPDVIAGLTLFKLSED